MVTAYADKLRDPRWQKKRLEILNRDEWTCQKCFDSDNTLVVHHRRYLVGQDPWDYEEQYLVTLCEECHEHERALMTDYSDDLLAMIHEKFLADDVSSLTAGFHMLELQHDSQVVASVYEWALSDPDIQRELTERYIKSLKKTRKVKVNGKSST